MAKYGSLFHAPKPDAKKVDPEAFAKYLKFLKVAEKNKAAETKEVVEESDSDHSETQMDDDMVSEEEYLDEVPRNFSFDHDEPETPSPKKRLNMPKRKISHIEPKCFKTNN